MDGAEIIARLEMAPHPEGGWFCVAWRAPAPADERPAGSAIYYLLRAGERSRRHRIDAAETWHHYVGDPVELVIGDPEGTGTEDAEQRHVLGHDLAAGERPQVTVPAGAWQRAAPLGAVALLGCSVAPAFAAETFELDPRDADEAPAGGAG